jgi:hypothetical protein
MNLSEAFPSKYLKAGDLPEDRPAKATIESVEMEEIGMEKSKKPVIHFSDWDKALVCNKTNGRAIAKALGSDNTDDWIGKTILLYRAEVEFQGDLVEAIRVKSKAQAEPPKLSAREVIPDDTF